MEILLNYSRQRKENQNRRVGTWKKKERGNQALSKNRDHVWEERWGGRQMPRAGGKKKKTPWEENLTILFLHHLTTRSFLEILDKRVCKGK